MNDLELELRTLLAAKAGQIPAPDYLPADLLRRARLRRAVSASLLCAVLVALAAGGTAASRGIFATDTTPPAGVELFDDSDLDPDMRPAGEVHLVATTASEKGEVTLLGWNNAKGALCTQLVARPKLLQTSCLPLVPSEVNAIGLPPGPLYLEAGRFSGWTNRIIYGAVAPEVRHLRARIAGDRVVPLAIHQPPGGLETARLSFVLDASIPGDATGTVVARGGGGRLAETRLIRLREPGEPEPQPPSDPSGDVLGSATTRGGRIDLLADVSDGRFCLGFALEGGGAELMCPGPRRGTQPVFALRLGWTDRGRVVVGRVPAGTDEVIAAHDVGHERVLVLADLPARSPVQGRAFLVVLPPDAWTVEARAGSALLGTFRIVVDGPSPPPARLTRGSTERCQPMPSEKGGSVPRLVRMLRTLGGPGRLAAALGASLTTSVEACSTEAKVVTTPRRLPQRD